jgi:hypothetical protein
MRRKLFPALMEQRSPFHYEAGRQYAEARFPERVNQKLIHLFGRSGGDDSGTDRVHAAQLSD